MLKLKILWKDYQTGRHFVYSRVQEENYQSFKATGPRIQGQRVDERVLLVVEE